MFRDISVFPVCAKDEDCQDIQTKTGLEHRCFMYMCFPWKNNPGPFRSCKSDSECVALTEREGGDGGDGECFRHHKRRHVFRGICVRQEEMTDCEEHSDCPADLRCVNRYCGENSYFEALHDDCDDDSNCRVTESQPRERPDDLSNCRIFSLVRLVVMTCEMTVWTQSDSRDGAVMVAW